MYMEDKPSHSTLCQYFAAATRLLPVPPMVRTNHQCADREQYCNKVNGIKCHSLGA